MNYSFYLIAAVQSAQLYKIISTCNAALFIYEFFLTIGDEVDLVWSSPRGTAVFLYAVSRYTAVPEICMEIIFAFGNFGGEQCKSVSGYVNFSIVVGMLLGQGIIVLRTWAIWKDYRTIIFPFAAAGIVSVGLSAFLSTEWELGSQFIASSALSPRLRGCAVRPPYLHIYAVWILFCCNDIALMCITIIKFRRDRSPGSFISSLASLCPINPKLTPSLYRDAFYYAIVMLAFALVNLAATLSVATHYRTLLYGTSRILYTSFACRIILNLRAASQRPVRVSTIGPDAMGGIADVVYGDDELTERMASEVT